MAARDGKVAYVEVRSVALRFKSLLHALPVPPGGVQPSREPSRTDEEFVISLYPLGVDRERAYALAEATGRDPVATRLGRE